MALAARAVTGPPSKPREWRSGLIMSHDHIGDVLYRTCSLPDLTRGLPGCRWSFLTGAAGSEVLRNNPDVHETLSLLGADGSLPANAHTELRSRRFDVVLCTNAFGGGRDLALGLRLKIPNRVALVFKGWSGLTTLGVRPPFPAPYPAYFRALVEAATGTPATSSLRPRIYWDSADELAGAAVLDQLGLSRPFWVCAPGTRQPAGAAPLAVVERVFRAVLRRSPHAVLVVGAKAEEPTLRALAATAPDRARVLAGAPGVRALAWILTRSSGALTQDSGPRHLANAAGVPTAFFRNLAVQRVLTGAYCETELDLSPPDDILEADQADACHARTDPEAAADLITEWFHLIPASGVRASASTRPARRR